MSPWRTRTVHWPSRWSEFPMYMKVLIGVEVIIAIAIVVVLIADVSQLQ